MPGGDSDTGNGGNPPGDDGLMDTNIDENGVMQYGKNWRVTREEWNRRWDLNIKLNQPKPEPKPTPNPGSGGNDAPPSGSPKYNFKPVPVFDAPEFVYDKQFHAPDQAALEADPGYQFRLSQGEKALQGSAAAKGVLRTGGTLKDILGYGQQFASQEYSNVFDRALTEFGTNYGTARDMFDRRYQGAKDEFAPKLFEWQTLTSAEQNSKNMGWDQLWKKWYYDHLSAADIFGAGNK